MITVITSSTSFLLSNRWTFVFMQFIALISLMRMMRNYHELIKKHLPLNPVDRNHGQNFHIEQHHYSLLHDEMDNYPSYNGREERNDNRAFYPAFFHAINNTLAFYSHFLSGFLKKIMFRNFEIYKY